MSVLIVTEVHYELHKYSWAGWLALLPSCVKQALQFSWDEHCFAVESASVWFYQFPLRHALTLVNKINVSPSLRASTDSHFLTFGQMLITAVIT